MKRRLAIVAMAVGLLTGCQNAPWQGYSTHCWPYGRGCDVPPCDGIACGTVTP